MTTITHAQDTHDDIPGLLAIFRDLYNSIQKSQQWDVEEGIAAVLIKCRENLPLLRPDHSRLPRALFVIAAALILRFEALGEVADVDDAIIYLDESLAIPQSWQDESVHDEIVYVAALSLTCLGKALMLRFEHWKDVEDMAAAIENYRIALVLVSSHNPVRQECLVALRRASVLKFKTYGRKEDADEAIQGPPKIPIYATPFSVHILENFGEMLGPFPYKKVPKWVYAFSSFPYKGGISTECFVRYPYTKPGWLSGISALHLVVWSRVRFT
ncbi:hypothetical protein PHLCEN_2v5382 [Hermanssonia centrifuga]|uniref:Uncharacterized protein n=1 Tax=Hermanssonia centrifuga TaxID=98765 RepID=A0A2R6P5F3_9APHY|nr:hypothetical protein PHLCEN_2v5382 [Hermanssonia centrifuga]